MLKILTVIGLCFTAYGALLCCLSNLNLGVLLTATFGVLLTALGIFYDKFVKITEHGFFRAVKIVVIAIVCIEFVLVGFIAFYGQNDNVDYTEDALVVLGCGLRGDRVTLPLKMRLDTAVLYHKINPNALIVVSGGQGFQETVTEAFAMKKYLVLCGVDEQVIVEEEKSTSTNENMRYSKAILDKRLGKDYKIAVVTNNFHIYRGVTIAGIEGFENVRHIHAGLQWYNLIPCYLRESLAVLKMWVFDIFLN